MGFCSREKDDFTEVSSESGDQWCNPKAELVPTSSLDGFELIQGGSKPLLLLWKHCGVILVLFFTGRKRVVYWSVHLYLGGILMSRGSWCDLGS